MDPSLDIKIRTTADTSGAKTAEQSLKKVGDAAQQAGQGTGALGETAKTATGELGQLSRAGASGSQVINGLERASRGGIQGILGITQATRGFIGLVRTAVAGSGPIGMFVTVLGLAAGAFALLRTRTSENAAAQKELAEDFKATSSEAAKLDAQQLAGLRAGLADANTKSETLLANFKLMLDMEGRRDRATTSANLAAIDADESLSPSERIAARAAVQQGLTERERARSDQVSTATVNRAQEEYARTEQFQQALAQRADTAQQARDEFLRQQNTRRTGIERLSAERDSLVNRRLAARETGFGTDREDKRIREVDRELAQLKKEEAAAAGTAELQLKNLEEAAAKSSTEFENVTQQLQKLGAALTALETAQAIEQAAQPDIRAAEDRKAQIERDTALRQAQPKAAPKPDPNIARLSEQERYLLGMMSSSDTGSTAYKTAEANLPAVQAELARSRKNASDLAGLIIDDSRQRSRDSQRAADILRANKERNGGG